jgi:hypothetical protein
MPMLALRPADRVGVIYGARLFMSHLRDAAGGGGENVHHGTSHVLAVSDRQWLLHGRIGSSHSHLGSLAFSHSATVLQPAEVNRLIAS